MMQIHTGFSYKNNNYKQIQYQPSISTKNKKQLINNQLQTKPNADTSFKALFTDKIENILGLKNAELSYEDAIKYLTNRSFLDDDLNIYTLKCTVSLDQILLKLQQYKQNNKYTKKELDAIAFIINNLYKELHPHLIYEEMNNFPFYDKDGKFDEELYLFFKRNYKTQMQDRLHFQRVEALRKFKFCQDENKENDENILSLYKNVPNISKASLELLSKIEDKKIITELIKAIEKARKKTDYSPERYEKLISNCINKSNEIDYKAIDEYYAIRKEYLQNNFYTKIDEYIELGKDDDGNFTLKSNKLKDLILLNGNHNHIYKILKAVKDNSNDFQFKRILDFVILTNEMKITIDDSNLFTNLIYNNVNIADFELLLNKIKERTKINHTSVINKLLSACINQKSGKINKDLLAKIIELIDTISSNKNLSKKDKSEEIENLDIIKYFANDNISIDEEKFAQLIKVLNLIELKNIRSIIRYSKEQDIRIHNLEEIVKIYNNFREEFYDEYKNSLEKENVYINETTTNSLFNSIFNKIISLTFLQNAENSPKVNFSKDKIKEIKDDVKIFGLNYYSALLEANKLTDETITSFKKILKLALENKQILRETHETLTNNEIRKMFHSRYLGIILLNKAYGEKFLLEAFKLKLGNFIQYVDAYKNLMTHKNWNNKIGPILAPKNTQKYNELTQRLSRKKEKLNDRMPTIVKENEEKNNQRIKELEIEITKLKKLLKKNPNDKKLKERIKEKQSEIKNIKQFKLKYINAPINQDLVKEINDIESKIKEYLANSLKDPQRIITQTRILNNMICRIDEKELDFYLSNLRKNSLDGDKKIDEFLNKKIYEKFHINNSTKLSEKVNLLTSPYLSNLLIENDADFFYNFKHMMALIDENIDSDIKTIFDELIQNKETRKIFEEKSINYEKWCDYDKDSYITVNVNIDVEQAKESVIRSLEMDLVAPWWEYINPKEKEILFSSIENAGYEIKESIIKGKRIKKLYNKHTQKRISFDELKDIIKKTKKVFNESEYWNKFEYENFAEDEAKDEILYNINSLKEKEIHNIENIKNNKFEQITINKTNMNDIPHSLFLGNQSSCCTSIGGGYNSWSAPQYIINKCVQAIEIRANNKPIGNTMCYIAEVDGVISLILDNIELTGEYQYNNSIRDAIIEYAKKLCKEIGKPNIPIYASPNRHKVYIDEFERNNHDIKILGKSDINGIYIDYLIKKEIITNFYINKNITLYKLG